MTPSLSPEAAAIHAEQVVKASGTSFYWAMRSLPTEQRLAMFAIYAFCREVDDIADDIPDATERRAGLKAWRESLDALYQGTATRPTAMALSAPIERFQLQKEDFVAVIDGMEMDAEGPIIAPDMATLDLYCDRVASAVGRLSNRVFGIHQPLGDQIAHHLGRALQLTNILRDVAEDAARGRLYIPLEALETAGIDPATPPQQLLDDSRMRKACLWLAQHARQHFEDADALLVNTPRERIFPVLVMRDVYETTLRLMEKAEWRDLHHAPRPGKFCKIWLLLRRRFLA